MEWRNARPAEVDASDEPPRLYTVVLAGVISQQIANEPSARYESGTYASLTDAALDMFLSSGRRFRLAGHLVACGNFLGWMAGA